jgi:uncharacterized protein
MFTVTVERLYLYPVKSCRPLLLDSAWIYPEGLGLVGSESSQDRSWMLVDSAGHFLSQRQVPALAAIQPALDSANHLTLHWCGPALAASIGSCLRLHPDECIGTRRVDVWRHTGGARLAPAAINHQLSQWLDRPGTQLVYRDSGAPRPLDAERFGEGIIDFADAAPYLMGLDESLQALNQQERALGLRLANWLHFRPNIVVAGAPAFSEQTATRLQLSGNPSFRLVDACQRCAIITLNPCTGERDSLERLTLLAALNPLPQKPKAPFLGMNATWVGPQSVVATGMQATLL